MTNPIRTLREQYEEIKLMATEKEFSSIAVKKFKALMHAYMESAKVDEQSKNDFSNTIKNLPDNFNEFILIVDPIMERIEEWFKTQKKKINVPFPSEWEKQMERESPGLTQHKKRQQRRKKY